MLTIALAIFSAASDIPFAGKLIVEPTTLDTEIFIDGLQCDESPCEMEVAAGWHEITVRKPGYETRTVAARVQPAQRSFVNVRLYPEPTTGEAREHVAKNVRLAAWTTLGAAAAATAGALIVNFAGYRPAYDAYQDQAARIPQNAGLETLQAQAALSQKAGELTRLNIATGGFAIAAGLAAAASITLFLVGPRPGQWTPTIAPMQGGGQVGLHINY